MTKVLAHISAWTAAIAIAYGFGTFFIEEWNFLNALVVFCFYDLMSTSVHKEREFEPWSFGVLGNLTLGLLGLGALWLYSLT